MKDPGAEATSVESSRAGEQQRECLGVQGLGVFGEPGDHVIRRMLSLCV